VDGAIHKAGGKAILDDCVKIRNKQGGCKVGEAVITTAGALPAKYVIHTVGPTWNAGDHNEEALLASCYHNCLRLATQNGVRSIAFPNISTGIYRFPKKKAAEIAIQTVRSFLGETNQIEKVLFVCYDEENFRLYSSLL